MTETKSDDYQRGYREGYLDGFHAARDNDSLMSPNVPMDKTLLKSVSESFTINSRGQQGVQPDDDSERSVRGGTQREV
jgi:hypothetical protein